jgi:hypothetical protein
MKAKIKNSRLLGRDELYAEAVLDALVEAHNAARADFFFQEPAEQVRMMEGIGRSLQALYRRDHPVPPLSTRQRPPTP